MVYLLCDQCKHFCLPHWFWKWASIKLISHVLPTPKDSDCGAADAGTPDLCLLPLVQLLLLLRWSLQCCPWAAAHQLQFYLYFFCEIDCWAKTFTFSTSSLVSAHSFISPESKVPLRLGVFYIWNKLGPIQMLMLTSSVFRWWEGSHFNLMTQTHLCCKVLLP